MVNNVYLCSQKIMEKMKHIYLYALVMGMMMLMGACSHDDDDVDDVIDDDVVVDDVPVDSTKTVLVYMAARNDLANAAEADLKEIKEGSKLIGEGDQLLVFVRRNVKGEVPWLARVKNGELIDSLSLRDLGITSMDGLMRASDPGVMEDVMHYVFSHYPSTDGNYGLVLWGHCTGWVIEDEVSETSRRAYGVDNGYTDPEMRDERWVNITTMTGILKRMPHMKFIMADCCNFMCLESLYELRDVCDYIIGSAAEIPNNGAPYDKIVPDMFSDDEAFYSSIVEKYYTSVWEMLPLAVVKTSEMENLADATRLALQAVKANIGDGYPDMTGHIHYNYMEMERQFHQENAMYYDAGEFFLKHAPAEDYQLWRQAYDRAVVDRRMATWWSTNMIWYYLFSDFTVTEETYHGVSMFVPQDPAGGNYALYNEQIKQMEWYRATH